MTLIVRLQKILLCCLLVLLMLTPVTQAEENDTSETTPSDQYRISTIKMEQTADDFLIRVGGESPPTYTMYELFDPLRVIIDIADASFSENIELPLGLPLGPVADVKSLMLDEQEPFIARIEIVLAEDRGYSVERQENDIVVTFAKEITAQPTEFSEEPMLSMAMAQEEENSEPLKEQASLLADIEIDDSSASETRIFLKTDGPIKAYKKAQLKKTAGRPDRMYIDIADITLPSRMIHLEVGTALARIRAAQRKGAVRIVFDSGLEDIFAYNIEKKSNGLMVTVTEPSPASSLIAGIMAKEEEQQKFEDETESNKIILEGEEELIKPIIPETKTESPQEEETAPKAEKKEEKADIPQGTFAFAGYEKQKITVDFFKIDLHNVFRLFGEVSELNMVVDESVKGTLTLALNDVPWDFALDIILNLKDLQKEERFNTIVISPKAKQFMWPKKATDQIAFKADGSIEKIDAISVKQKLKTPKAVVEAKKLIYQANINDKKGDYAAALPLYEQAFAQWPENTDLADRIASICLVHLGMNAKAVHYAKAALKAEPNNYNASLQAAIGLANMKKLMQAKEYFDKSISNDRPASEALASYAAFSEEYKSYNAALALLDKHEEIYGDTLDTMIAKARVYDKKGDDDRAVKEYRSILLSGFELPGDLKKYINGRVAASTN